MSKYHKTDGGLWPNTEKNQSNHPDSTGKVVISSEQIKGLIAMGKEGKEVKIELSAWDRKNKDTGQPFQYVRATVFWDAEAQATPPPPPPPPQPESQTIPFEEDDIPF